MDGQSTPRWARSSYNVMLINIWRFRQGASIMLFVMDSNGSPGGVPQTVYTVTGSSYADLELQFKDWHTSTDGNSGCFPPPPTVNITLSANVSGTLETCEPVEFQISGGKRPYSITVVQSNANVIHNNTLGDQSGNFTFTNQVDADAQIIGAPISFHALSGAKKSLTHARFAVTSQSLSMMRMAFGAQRPSYSTLSPAPNLPVPVSFLHRTRSLHQHQSLTRSLSTARRSSWLWSYPHQPS